MVITDFDTFGSFLSPAKANAPLIVDPDAVLAGSIAFQRLEAVRSEPSKIFEPRCGSENCHTAARLIGKARELLDPLPVEEPFRPFVVAASDHRQILSRLYTVRQAYNKVLDQAEVERAPPPPWRARLKALDGHARSTTASLADD
jgi:hypothetical protein